MKHYIALTLLLFLSSLTGSHVYAVPIEYRDIPDAIVADSDPRKYSQKYYKTTKKGSWSGPKYTVHTLQYELKRVIYSDDYNWRPFTPNGCSGISGFGTSILDGFLGLDGLESKCNTHDACYTVIGNDRAKCDSNLKASLKNACADAYGFLDGPCRGAVNDAMKVIEGQAGQDAFDAAQNHTITKMIQANHETADLFGSEFLTDTVKQLLFDSAQILYSNEALVRLDRRDYWQLATEIFSMYGGLNGMIQMLTYTNNPIYYADVRTPMYGLDIPPRPEFRYTWDGDIYNRNYYSPAYWNSWKSNHLPLHTIDP